MRDDPFSECRVPPQNLEAEQSTLGSMMIDRDAAEKGIEILCAEDFYRPAHQVIFDAVKRLFARNEPVDLITMQEELRKHEKLDDIGGTEYLMALVDSVPTAANIEYYARIVEKKAILWRLIKESTKTIERAYASDGDDLNDLIAEAETSIMQIGDKRTGINIVRMGDVYGNLYGKLPTYGNDYGVPIGLAPLAKLCISFAKGTLIVIGARPRIGKSAVAADLLDYAAGHGHPAGIISCEMSDEEYGLREFAKESGVHLYHMLSGNLQDHHYEKIVRSMSKKFDVPLYFYNATGKKMADITAAARRMVKMGVEIIALDHMHRVKPDNPRDSDVSKMNQIASDCKDMARQLNIPVLALAQLNREVDKRGPDSRPVVGDLKGSGGIEENADVILLLWRKLGDENTRSMQVTEAEIIVAKNRMLVEGVAKCGFHGRKFKFVDRIEMEEQNTPKTKPQEATLAGI